MHNYTIMKLEADEGASQDGIVGRFNEYMLSSQHLPAQSFVQGSRGYFRVEYSDAIGASSAGIVAFGNFLSASGLQLSGMQDGKSAEGEPGTKVSFSDGSGKTRTVVLSTVMVY